MLHKFSLPSVLVDEPVVINQERQYSLSFENDEVRTLLARLVTGCIVAELMGAPVLCPNCFDLALIDSLVPDEACNVVMTRRQYQKLTAFVGAVAIVQSRQTEPILDPYTRVQIGQLLSRFFFLPLTRLQPFLSI